MVVACKMCLFSLYFVRYMMFITLDALYGMIEALFVYNSALRKFDFRERWSVSPKNSGRLFRDCGSTMTGLGRV